MILKARDLLVIQKAFVFSLFLFFSLALSAKEPDYSTLIKTGREAVVVMESVQERLAGVIRPFLKMMDDGVKEVSKEYWDKNVTPALLAADKELSSLPERLEAVIPENINVRSKDLKDEPWISVYDIAGSIEAIDLKRQTEVFDSEYILILIGAETYVQMYASLLHTRYDMIERTKSRLQSIIDDPSGFRRQSIEEKEREEREAKEKERKAEEDKRLHALKKSPPIPAPELDSYHSPFLFAGVPLGLEYHDCIKRLRAKGFKLEKEEVDDSFFCGYTPIAFLSGTFQGNPVRIKIQASPNSYRIYEMEVTISQIVDEYEAEEVIKRLALDFAVTHPNHALETKEGTQTLTITESIDATGKRFKKTGIPSGGLILRDFSVPGDKDTYTGMMSLDAIKDTGHGYFIWQRIYDSKLGDVAHEESK